MKTVSTDKINNNYMKLRTFNKLKLFDCEKINKIFDKSLYISNKLSKELNHLCSLDTSIIKETNKTYIHENMKNKIKKFITNKIQSKDMKSSIFKSHIINKKLVSSFEEEKKENNKKQRIYYSFSKKDVNLKNSNNKMPINNKNVFRKIVIKESNNNKVLNNLINISNKSNSLITQNYEKNINSLEKSVNDYDKYKKIFRKKSFITQQKFDYIKRNNNSIKNEESSRKKKIYRKILLKDNIKNLINSSSTLYDNEIINLKKSNKSIISSRPNYYHITNLIKQYEMSKSIENELEYNLYDDKEIRSIYNEIKHFNNSFKGKITKNKDFIKSTMITKNNADIINYCDYINKMDDMHFYKNNKIYNDYYPLLSEKARKVCFKRDIRKNLHNNNFEKKNNDIIKLVKSCKKICNKINQLVDPIEKRNNI